MFILLDPWHQRWLAGLLLATLWLTGDLATWADPPGWMSQKPPHTESLVSILQRIDKLDKLMEPYPALSTPDPLYRFDIAQRNQYKSYLRKIAPTYDHLMGIAPALQPQQDSWLNLQHISAVTHHAKLLWDRTLPFLNEEERAYASSQLIQRTVANLYESVQYWRLKNQSQQPFRSSQTNESEDDYVIQTKLIAARESLAELQRLGDLAALLETGFKPQEGSQ